MNPPKNDVLSDLSAEVDIRADETDSAGVTTEIEANVVQIEVGRSLRNVGQEIKKLAAEMKDSGEDVSNSSGHIMFKFSFQLL